MKRAILRVSPEFLGELFRNNKEIHVKVELGLPIDAEFLRAWCDQNPPCFNLVFESSDFADVKSGGRMPVLPLPFFREVRHE